MSGKDVNKIYTLSETGKAYGEECASKQAAKGYEYRMSDDYDWHPDTFSQELLYNLERGPVEEEKLVTKYFAYENWGEVPYKLLKDHLAFLVKEGHITMKEVVGNDE